MTKKQYTFQKGLAYVLAIVLFFVMIELPSVVNLSGPFGGSELFLWAGCLLFCIGLCFWIQFRAENLYRHSMEEGCTYHVTASISGVDSVPSYGEHGIDYYQYHPVYEYTAPDGRTVHVRSWDWSSDPKKYKLGQTEELLIDPQHKERYRLYSSTVKDSTTSLTPFLVMMAAGAVLYILSLL